MLSRIEAVSKRVNEAVGRLPATLLVLLTIGITVDALMRYAFDKPIAGRVEISGLLMVYIVYFGLAYAMDRGAHIQVTVFTSRMPRRVHAVDEFFLNIVGIFAFGLLAYVSWKLFWSSLMIGELMMAPIDIPVWIGMLAVPIGAFFMWFRFILRFISNCIQLSSRKR